MRVSEENGRLGGLLFNKKVVVFDVDWNFFCNFAAVIVSEDLKK